MQRLRLELSEALLTPASRQQGLGRCWFWPSSAAVTIADFTSEIYAHLCLDYAGGASGLRLVLDGFTLPPDGPVGLLRDGDLIAVQKLAPPRTLQLQAAIADGLAVPYGAAGAIVAVGNGGAGGSGAGAGDGRGGKKRKRRSVAGATAAGGVGGGGGAADAALPNVGDDAGYQEQQEDTSMQQHQQPTTKARRLAALAAADANASPALDGRNADTGERTGPGLLSSGGGLDTGAGGGDGAAAAAEGGLDVASEGGMQAGADMAAGEEKRRSRSARRKAFKRQLRRTGVLPYQGAGASGGAGAGSVPRRLRPAGQKKGLAQEAVEKKVQQQQRQQQAQKQQQLRQQRPGQTSAVLVAALAASPLDPNGTLPGAVGLHPHYGYYAEASAAAAANRSAAADVAGAAAAVPAQKPAQPRPQQQKQSQTKQGPSATATRGVAGGYDGGSAGPGPSGTNAPAATAARAAGGHAQGLISRRGSSDPDSDDSDDDDSDSGGGTVRKPPAAAAAQGGAGSSSTSSGDSSSTSSEGDSDEESDEADGDGGGAVTVTKATTKAGGTTTSSADSDDSSSEDESSSSSSESISCDDETSSEDGKEEEEAVEKEEVKEAPPPPWAVSGSLPDASSIAAAEGAGPMMGYDRLPPFNRSAAAGDVLAYKLLELGLDMCPRVSEWRQGRVTFVDTATGAVVLQPHPDPRVHPLQRELDALRARLEAEAASGGDGDANGIAGEGRAFELDWEALPFPTDYDPDGLLTVTLDRLADVRALSTAAAKAAPAPTPEAAKAATLGASPMSTPGLVAAAGSAAAVAPGPDVKRPATRALVMASAGKTPTQPIMPPPPPGAHPSAAGGPCAPRGTMSRPSTPRPVRGTPTASARRPLPPQQQQQQPTPSRQGTPALVVARPLTQAAGAGAGSASTPGVPLVPPPGSIVAAVGGWAAIAEELRQKRLELGTQSARPPVTQAPGISAYGHHHYPPPPPLPQQHHHQQQQRQQRQQQQLRQQQSLHGHGGTGRMPGPAGQACLLRSNAAGAGSDGSVSRGTQLPVSEVTVPGFKNEETAPKNDRAGSGTVDMAYHGYGAHDFMGLGLETGRENGDGGSGGTSKGESGPGGAAASVQTPGAVRPRGGARRIAMGPMLSFLRSNGGL